MNLSVGATTLTAARMLGICCLLLLGGCREKDVPYIIDSEEIENYLKQSEDAVNLFRPDGLVRSGTYSLLPGGPTYRDTVLSSSRSYDVWVSDTAWHLGAYGNLKVAEATVTDEFVVRTTRKLNSDSLVTQQTRRMDRIGVFWKLGDDSEPYVGWLLWGIVGGSHAGSAITITTIAGSYRLDTLSRPGDTTRSGKDYIRIREGMPAVIPGGQLGVSLSTTPRLYPLISSITNDGYFTSPIPPGDSGRFVTTVQLPDTYERIFDVALIQFVNDSLGTASADPVFIPYKVLH
ncbi:hypothetical protein C3F09_00140 [candidate division GN15 bacterium]|uniref:Uncharacterized protein n=1 Tax=candidate division GN15 bacterium TaxID=2072418 RepID=A0A855XDQ5_9BACT|nr:MAG: hypothetical protein C3F09_00140 [candidate division GN15 bacterium]